LIFDSTTLIYFSKLKILDKLANLNAKRIIPKSVYAEVVTEGKHYGKEDAFLFDILVSEGVFSVNAAKDKKFMTGLSSIPSIADADAETLALAKELKGIAILNGTASSNIAEIGKIKFHGSVFLLFILHKEKLIPKKEIKANIDGMIKLGWHCSTELYAAILGEIENM
jgi:predicted nucleic acid-binding protein